MLYSSETYKIRVSKIKSKAKALCHLKVGPVLKIDATFNIYVDGRLYMIIQCLTHDFRIFSTKGKIFCEKKLPNISHVLHFVGSRRMGKFREITLWPDSEYWEMREKEMRKFREEIMQNFVKKYGREILIMIAQSK